MESIITAIEEYHKSKYKIFINDEFAFVLYKGELRRYGIKKGIPMTEELYHELVDQVLTKRAKLRAMHLLEKNDRTEADVRRKLRDNLYPQAAIDAAVTYVMNYHYIDDERYAQNYIHYKSSTSSKNEIKQTLLRRGIRKDIVEEALSISEIDETNLIMKLIQKRCKEPQMISYEEKQKLFGYLYRKGFHFDQIEYAWERCREHAFTNQS